MIAAKESTASMAGKSLKNYLYDNPELKETKNKKACNDEDDFADDDDVEVWLLQCPKSFDPKQILNCELGKLGKKSGGPKVECSADRFGAKKTLAVITPEKAAEYEMFCDSIKIVKPVGKIVVSETCTADKENFDTDRRKTKTESEDFCSDDPISAAQSCDSEENDERQKTEDDSNSSDQDAKPIAGKKLKKKLNDQRFTIETTVTVQNVGKKKGKKNQCLPIVPPEPSPEKKKKKSKGGADDWKC